jgi:hypothetical protein
VKEQSADYSNIVFPDHLFASARHLSTIGNPLMQLTMILHEDPKNPFYRNDFYSILFAILSARYYSVNLLSLLYLFGLKRFFRIPSDTEYYKSKIQEMRNNFSHLKDKIDNESILSIKNDFTSLCNVSTYYYFFRILLKFYLVL